MTTSWHFQNAKWRPRWPPFHEFGHISATDHPIHFVFGSIWYGFRGRPKKLVSATGLAGPVIKVITASNLIDLSEANTDWFNLLHMRW